jgi:hypothetical protein
MKLERTGWNCDEAQYARQRHDIRFSCDNQEVKNLCQKQAESRFNTRSMVRMKGLEPPRISTAEPKSAASTNFATSAFYALQNN